MRHGAGGVGDDDAADGEGKVGCHYAEVECVGALGGRFDDEISAPEVVEEPVDIVAGTAGQDVVAAARGDVIAVGAANHVLQLSGGDGDVAVGV